MSDLEGKANNRVFVSRAAWNSQHSANVFVFPFLEWNVYIFSSYLVPSNQPAPFAEVLSQRVILLTWSPPDSPNGLISRYDLYRNGTLIYSGLNQTFNDTSLTPDTVYYYYIITFTAGGSTRSLNDGRVYRTFQDAPGGKILTITFCNFFYTRSCL